MSVSVCIDTVDAQGAGVCTIGDEGGGLLGSAIASSGANGPGYAYNDLALPADAGKEICGRITTWPVSGTLYAYEDTSFTYAPVGDGATSFQYQLYVDYAPIGSPQTVTLTSGGGAATAAGATLTGISSITAGAASGASAGTAPGATLSGVSSISAGAASGQVSATASGATLSGISSIQAGVASGEIAALAPGAIISGISTIEAGSASGTIAASATASGAILIGSSSISVGQATAMTYARAPAGDGYHVRPSISPDRPAATQGRCR